MPFLCFKKKSVSLVEEEYGGTAGETVEDALKSFFVITTVFNPVGYNSRYELYYDFVQHMKDTGAQLITVECIFPELGQTEFKVTSPDNPNHIQIKSRAVYWMKENLINIAVSRLPAHAQWVCWLDADIHFEDKNWIQLTVDQLAQYTVVQIFKKCKFLGPKPEAKVLRIDYSFGYSVVRGKPIDQQRYDEWYPHPGYGWAISLQAFHLMNGLPEYDILGSADLHFAFSLINKVSNAVENNLNPRFTALILGQSAETYRVLSEFERPGTSGSNRVGFVPVTISHNWHGSRKDRQYVDRWKILIAHQFDFERDMERTPGGLLEFVPGKEALQKDILDHFRLRDEDSKEIEPDKKDRRRDDEDHYWRSQQQQFGSLSPNRHHSRRESGEVMVVAVATETYPPESEPPIDYDDDEPRPGNENCDPSRPCPEKEGEDCGPCPVDPPSYYETQVTAAATATAAAVIGGYMDDYGGAITTTSYY